MRKTVRLLIAACLLVAACPAAQAQTYNLAMFNAHDADTYYFATGQDIYYPFALTDMGPQMGQTLKYSYSVNNGAPVHQVAAIDHNHASNCVNAVNLSKYRVALSTPLNFSTPGVYSVKIWVDSINGQADANHNNDTLYRTFKAMTYVPKRKGLTEYAYHVSCGPCGEVGDPFFKNLLAHYDDYTVGVKLHKYDGTGSWAYLNCPEAFAIDTVIGDIAHPDFTYNRAELDPFINNDFYYPDPNFCPLDSNFLTKDVNFTNKVPVDMTVDQVQVNYSTRIVTFTVNAQFADALTFTKETRMSCMLAEDSIFYYQANNSTNPIDSIWHRYVLRKVYGGPWGQQGSMPASVIANQMVSLTFTDTLPANYNMNRLHLIPTLQYYGATKADREILNVRRYKLDDLVNPAAISTATIENANLYVYPNPANDKVNVEWKGHAQVAGYSLYSAAGVVCGGASAITNGPLTIATNELAPGLYFVRVWDEKGVSAVARVVVRR